MGWHPRSPDACALAVTTDNLMGVGVARRSRDALARGARGRVPAAARAGLAMRAAGHGPGRRAGLPGGWAASTRRGRRVLLPAGQRPAWPWGFVAALVRARETPGRRVPGGPRAPGSATPARPSCERLRVPAGAPGPAWRAGPDRPRLPSYRAGEGWGRGASGARAASPRRAGVGGRRVRGGLRDAVGARVPAPCPPTRSGLRVTWLVQSGSRHFLSAPPPALWASDAGRGQSRCPASPRRTALGAGAPERPGEPSRARLSAPGTRLPASPLGPGSRSSATLSPSPLWSREGKGAGWQPQPPARTVLRPQVRRSSRVSGEG